MSDRPFDQQDFSQPGVEPDRSTKDAATDEAKSVARDAKEGGRAVAETATDEVRQVAGEAKDRAMDLFQQVRGEATGQASDQQQRAAGGLRTLAGEFSQMADAGQQGMAGDLVRQFAGRLEGAAGFLENREPADVLDEVRRFARRKPGTFLAIAAAVGFIGGRMTRGLTADAKDEERRPEGGQFRASYPSGTTYAAAPGGYPAPAGYEASPAHQPPTPADYQPPAPADYQSTPDHQGEQGYPGAPDDEVQR